jgi:flagellar motility protein MotE (MotC chaperone)
MPYRRLPNTDLARIRAMKAAIKKGNILSPIQLSFSQILLAKLKPFCASFEKAVEDQRRALHTQAEKNKEFVAVFKKAQMYVSISYRF